jgi:hypothetical protein
VVCSTLTVLAVLEAAAPSSVWGQRTMTVQDTPTCESCTLELVPSTVIHDTLGVSGLSTYPRSLARTEDGELLVVAMGFEPLRFDADGEFLGTLGREGEGPGEFSAVGSVAVRGDTVVTYDFGLGRLSTWAASGEFLGAAPLPGISSRGPVEFSDGSRVISRAYRRPGSEGLPFHRFDREGRWLASFGPGSEVSGEGGTGDLTWVLAPGPGDTFWASRLHTYSLGRFTADGDELVRLEREAPWFLPGSAEPQRVTLENPPPSEVRSLQVGGDGRIWVVSTVADPEWRDGMTPADSPEDRDRVADFTRVFDSVIEILDPTTGQLVVSQRVDPLLVGFADDRHVVGYDVDEWRIPILQVFEVVLHDPGERPDPP